MKKRLLTKDYQNIVLESFKMPKNDWYNYFLNIVEKKYRYHNDIVEQFEKIVYSWIDFYKSQVYGGPVHVKNLDGTIECFDINQTWIVDENGKKTAINIEEKLFPLLIENNGKKETTDINRAFFDKQLQILDTIQNAINLKLRLISFEKELPEPIRKILSENPMPDGFDFEDLESRAKLLIQTPKLIEQHKSELEALINQYTPPQQTEAKTGQDTPTFKNNFDTIKPTDVYEHFRAGLVQKGYLTEQELNEYLKAAFELKTIPETLFKIKDAPKKTAIEAVFYKYYKNVAGKIHGKQNQYASLLGNYFEGYKTTTVSSNFSKSVY